MATLGELTNEILEDIYRGSDYAPRVKRAIETAIKSYRSKRVGFNIKRAKATITSGMEYVKLPLDWIEADFMQLKDGSERSPLDEVTYDRIEDEMGDTADRDEPYWYAVQNRQLRLYPIPDRTYTLVFSYQFEWKNVSKGADDNTTNPWLDEGLELIRCKAMADLYVNYLGGAENVQLGRDKQIEAEGTDPEVDGGILGRLIAQAAREQSSGRIKPFM